MERAAATVRSPRPAVGAGQEEEVVHDRAESEALVADHVQRLAQLVARAVVAGQGVFGLTAYDRHRGAHLVRGIGGKA